jgi:6-pyruvoyltetrahydropterin/6-carboxytetrahydropterin synthase
MNRTVRMTRRITFSSGHRYWRADLTPEENRTLFGPIASPFSHGHNYVLDVEVAGPVGEVDGMLVNIKRVDDLLKTKVKAVFDQRSINDEVPEFSGRAPSVENLLLDLKRRLCDAQGNLAVSRTPGEDESVSVRLSHLRLEEMPTLYGELDPMNTEVTLTRVYEFAAAHRLNSAQLPDTENVALYGKCNHVNGHGHNYVLEVTVAGTPDVASGFICDLGELDQAVEIEILDRYDHRNLDLDVPELAGKVTTSENVSLAIFDRLKTKTPARLARVRLWETARNCFEVSA